MCKGKNSRQAPWMRAAVMWGKFPYFSNLPQQVPYPGPSHPQPPVPGQNWYSSPGYTQYIGNLVGYHWDKCLNLMMTCSLSSHGSGLQSVLREDNFIPPQSPKPIIVRPQFNLKTSILNSLSDRAYFLVQVSENTFLSSGYCSIG